MGSVGINPVDYIVWNRMCIGITATINRSNTHHLEHPTYNMSPFFRLAFLLHVL